MVKFFIFIFGIAVILVVIFGGFGGSENVFKMDRVFVETEDERFVRGRELATAGRNLEAIAEFEKIIAEHPESSAESHFETGLLSFKQHDYPTAIYHFKRYLTLRPDAGAMRSKQVSGMIDSAQKRFFQELFPTSTATTSGTGISTELEAKYRAVMLENETLKREISALRERIGRAEKIDRTPAVPATATVAVAPEKPKEEIVSTPPSPLLPSVPATHTVAPGDTLSSISKKYYGTSNRWRDIYNANRVSMSSPSELRPGMVLKLPRP